MSMFQGFFCFFALQIPATKSNYVREDLQDFGAKLGLKIIAWVDANR